MTDPLRKEARHRLLDEWTGLMSEEELVVWADAKIAGLDKVPDYLEAISNRQRLDHVKCLDLLIDEIVEEDCKLFAERLVIALESGRIGYHAAGVAAYRMTLLSDEHNDSKYDLFWISEDLHLVDRGDADKEAVHEMIMTRLKDVAGVK